MPAGELAHSVVSLEHLLGDESVRLSERLEGASTWRARFGVLDEVLLRRLSDIYVTNHAVAEAWAALAEAGNTTTVSALAKQVGYSRRHLADLFSRELGLPPRAMARVIRFERSRVLLRHEGGGRLAAVAAAAGYYDQAHMARGVVGAHRLRTGRLGQ